MKIEDYDVDIYAGGAGAPLVLMNAFENEGKETFEELRKLTASGFSLAAVRITKWNRDMSPWEAAPVFRNDDPFTGGADAYLDKLTGEILPAVINELGSKPAYIALAGYSLAGLFAVYAMYRTSAFSRIVSASGSMWYPEFVEFAKSHELASRPEKLYLSLGDKESKTRNKIMEPVERNTAELHECYRSLGIDTVFELNPGNHFQNPADRLAKGIAWVLGDR